MDKTIAGMRPDPRVREPQLAQLTEICAEVARSKQGAIVFLAGEPGCGRSATLRALAERLRTTPHPRPVVLAGTLAGGKYAPLVGDRRPFEQTLGLLGEILALPALFTNPQFYPIVGLIAQLLQAGAVSATFVRDSFKADSDADRNPGLLLKRHLREVALHRTVICLLDGIDNAEAHLLNTVFSTSSDELTRDRPLFIVATLDGPVASEVEDAEDLPDAQSIAASLVRRGRARWMPLLPMTRDEIAAWLGRVQPGLAAHLHQITSGNPDWLAFLWDDLWNRGKVRLDAERDRWELAPGHELATLGTVEDILGERLQELVDISDPGTLDTTFYLLAIAALEGATFTAASLAEVLGWEEDELVDFLDAALVMMPDRPAGILEEADPVSIPGVEQDRCLWRYRFVSSLFWHTLERYVFAAGERTELCLELAESLESSYGSEVRLVARTLARLFADGGEIKRAAHYRTMGESVDSADNLYCEAQLLMASPRTGWQLADHVHAAERLVKAASATFDVYPFLVSLHIGEAAYADAVSGQNLQLQAAAKNVQAFARHMLGDPARALALYAEALSIQRQVGDRAGEARTLSNMAGVYPDTGDPARALALYEEALPILRQAGDRVGEALTLSKLARVYADTGDPDRALKLCAEALPILRQIGDRAGEARTLGSMGWVYMQTGYPARALALYAEALPIHRQVGDRLSEARALSNIGWLYTQTGDLARVLALYAEALPIQRQVGDQVGEARTLSGMGWVYMQTGDPARALALYEEALSIVRQIGDRAGEAWTIGWLGVLAAAIGMPVAGLKLIIMGTTLLTNAGYATTQELTAHIARLSEELKYDSAKIEGLRAEVMAAYARDKGDQLIRDAFPSDAS